MPESCSLSMEVAPAGCPACRSSVQSAAWSASPFKVLHCMLGTVCVFAAATFVLWNALKLWLGPCPRVLWMKYTVCMWNFGVVPIIRKQLEPFCFQLSHYCLPLRNMLESNKYAYIIENLYNGYLTRQQCSGRESFSEVNDRPLPRPVLRAPLSDACAAADLICGPDQSSHRRGGSAHETHGRCHFRNVVGRTFRKRFLFLHLDHYIFKFSWNSSVWILLTMVLRNSHQVVRPEAGGYPVGSRELEAVSHTCPCSWTSSNERHVLVPCN